MLLTDYTGWMLEWKRKFVCKFMPTKENVNKSNKELRRFIKEIYSDMNYLKDQCERLAQDQYAKAHLNEVLSLRDSFQTTLMAWDETVHMLMMRIDNIERHIGVKNG